VKTAQKFPEKALSANSLFHFTSGIDYLTSILDNGLCPRFCIEDLAPFLPKLYPDAEVAQPMVCFCDIPLSLIHRHISKYGYYGIGFTKEWGKSHGVSPVVYVYPHAATSDLMRLILYKAFLCQAQVDLAKLDEVMSPIHVLKNYFKTIRGRMFRGGRYTEEVFHFYDEREWRYVPFDILDRLAQDGHHVRVFLTKDEFLTNDVREYHHRLLADHCAIKFTADDIRYVFVRAESEVPLIVEHLKRDAKTRNGVRPDEALFRRIVSVERLMEDV
jgi:hypothetical protein